MLQQSKVEHSGSVTRFMCSLQPPQLMATNLNHSSNEIKALTVHSITNNSKAVTNGPTKTMLPGGSATAAAIVGQPKMISITSNNSNSSNNSSVIGHSSAGGNANNYPRFGILGTSVGAGGTAKSAGIISLSNASLQKGYIFTNAANAPGVGAGGHSGPVNLVNISTTTANNFAALPAGGGQATKIFVTPSHIITGNSRTVAVSSTTTGAGASAFGVVPPCGQATKIYVTPNHHHIIAGNARPITSTPSINSFTVPGVGGGQATKVCITPGPLINPRPVTSSSIVGATASPFHGSLSAKICVTPTNIIAAAAASGGSRSINTSSSATTSAAVAATNFNVQLTAQPNSANTAGLVTTTTKGGIFSPSIITATPSRLLQHASATASSTPMTVTNISMPGQPTKMLLTPSLISTSGGPRPLMVATTTIATNAFSASSSAHSAVTEALTTISAITPNHIAVVAGGHHHLVTATTTPATLSVSLTPSQQQQQQQQASTAHHNSHSQLQHHQLLNNHQQVPPTSSAASSSAVFTAGPSGSGIIGADPSKLLSNCWNRPKTTADHLQEKTHNSHVIESSILPARKKPRKQSLEPRRDLNEQKQQEQQRRQQQLQIQQQFQQQQQQQQQQQKLQTQQQVQQIQQQQLQQQQIHHFQQLQPQPPPLSHIPSAQLHPAGAIRKVDNYPQLQPLPPPPQVQLHHYPRFDLDEDEEKPEPVIYLKRPRPKLRDAPNFLTKSTSHPLHFIQHGDVKPKTEKKVLITELFSEVERPNVTWKVNHIAEQLQQSLNDEKDIVTNTLTNFLEIFERDICPFSKVAATQTLTCNPLADSVSLVDRVCVKINDMTRGSLQRSNLACDLFKDSKQLLLKLSTEHKDKIALLKSRMGNSNKRSYVKQ